MRPRTLGERGLVKGMNMSIYARYATISKIKNSKTQKENENTPNHTHRLSAPAAGVGLFKETGGPSASEQKEVKARE